MSKMHPVSGMLLPQRLGLEITPVDKSQYDQACKLLAGRLRGGWVLDLLGGVLFCPLMVGGLGLHRLAPFWGDSAMGPCQRPLAPESMKPVSPRTSSQRGAGGAEDAAQSEADWGSGGDSVSDVAETAHDHPEGVHLVCLRG